MLRKKEWYERCREWLITAGGRRLWEKDMVWGKNKSDPEVSPFNFLTVATKEICITRWMKLKKCEQEVSHFLTAFKNSMIIHCCISHESNKVLSLLFARSLSIRFHIRLKRRCAIKLKQNCILFRCDCCAYINNHRSIKISE